MAARTLFLKLEQRGWIELPACRCASHYRMRHQTVPQLAQTVSQETITELLVPYSR
jgi:hypothetical protein